MHREPLDDDKRQVAQRRLATAQALLRAQDEFAALQAAVAGCDSLQEAREMLKLPPYGFGDVEVDHVLDLPLSTRTVAWRAMVEDEVRGLQSLLNDDS